jgi:ketosteroid isomerase-like protein
MTRDDEEVRAASARFYEALNQLCRGDPARMPDVWHQTAHVSTVHPFGDWAYGWEQAWATWQEIAQSARNGTVLARDLKIFVYGTMAYTTGVEDVTVSYGETVARWSANVTNVFSKTDGEWKMIHHHSDKAPAAEEALERLTGH